jgi:hypothetical protein
MQSHHGAVATSSNLPSIRDMVQSQSLTTSQRAGAAKWSERMIENFRKVFANVRKHLCTLKS